MNASGVLSDVELIVTGGADNKIICYEVSKASLLDKESNNFSFNILTSKASAHENDVNCLSFHPKNPLLLASCSDDGFVKLWLVNMLNSQ